MRCTMLHPIDGDWRPFRSLRAARDAFEALADDALNRWGQDPERFGCAWIVWGHFDEFPGDAYPDRVLTYTPRGSVRVERA